MPRTVMIHRIEVVQLGTISFKINTIWDKIKQERNTEYVALSKTEVELIAADNGIRTALYLEYINSKKFKLKLHFT